MNYWLITYQVSRDGRVTWETWNDVTVVTPADWLNDFYRHNINKRVGYTDVVLTHAMTITEDEYNQLSKVLDR